MCISENENHISIQNLITYSGYPTKHLIPQSIMRQPAPLRDHGIEQVLIQIVAPGTTNASSNARDERHITLDERTSLRGGLERYQLNRDALIGGQSYDFCQLYAEDCNFRARMKVANELFNICVWQKSTDIRQDQELMRQTLEIIETVQDLIRAQNDRVAKFETVLYTRKSAEAEYAESKERNGAVVDPVEAEPCVEVSTADIEQWLRESIVFWGKYSQMVAKVFISFTAVCNGDFPNIDAAVSGNL